MYHQLRIFAVLIFLGAASSSQAAPPDMKNLFGGGFELVDHSGNTVSDQDFTGRYMLIYFGYTFCPDICPTGLSTMATALDLLEKDASGIQPLFVTIDPERDTPAVLKDYVAAFHPRLVGLSGSEAQVASVAKKYRIHRSKVLEADKPRDEYLVNHSSLTYLMGPDGSFLTIFPHGTKAEFMVTAVRKYLNKKIAEK